MPKEPEDHCISDHPSLYPFDKQSSHQSQLIHLKKRQRQHQEVKIKLSVRFPERKLRSLCFLHLIDGMLIPGNVSHRRWRTSLLLCGFYRDLCFPRRQRLKHCSRPFIHRQWARTRNRRPAPAEQYTAMTVLSSGMKHFDKL